MNEVLGILEECEFIRFHMLLLVAVLAGRINPNFWAEFHKFYFDENRTSKSKLKYPRKCIPIPRLIPPPMPESFILFNQQ